jgi:hypothetical protein
MQTNLFTKEQINRESAVGEFYEGKINYDPLLKLYFNYPGVEELYSLTRKALSENKRVIFNTKAPFENTDIRSNAFLKNSFKKSKNLFDGSMTSLFGSLLTANNSGQKVLGNYCIGFIEAQASKLFHEHYHQNQAVDHFYNAQGVCNLSILAETLKAYDIKKNELVSLLLPANSIRAFRDNKYSAWNTVSKEIDNDNATRIYLIDKSNQKTQATINLVSEKIINLESPIYKVRVDDKWIIVIPWQSSINSLDKEVSFEISNKLLDNLKQNKNTLAEESQEVIVFNTSIGQATRVIFELLDGDFENIPEAILNFEGGSWSSITLENSSTGRHQGINSMHEVLYHKWYEHHEIAIPWNYLGFDQLTNDNKNLINDNDTYVLSFDDRETSIENKDCFIEANQSWKKIMNEVSKYIVKFVYREFSAIASKKYLLSTKEIMMLVTKFLANWCICDFDNKDANYQQRLEEQKIPSELNELLECIAYSHLIISSQSDFHSSKTHSLNISRLKSIARIQRILEKYCPISVKNFKQKIFDLLQKDTLSESTTLWQIYQKEIR